MGFLGVMNRRKVTYPLTYFASGAQARQKQDILLDSSPTKQVLPQGRFKIENKPQATVSGKRNRLVNQEVRDSYGDEAAEGAAAIFQGGEDFVGADNKFEAAHAEESVARARS